MKLQGCSKYTQFLDLHVITTINYLVEDRGHDMTIMRLVKEKLLFPLATKKSFLGKNKKPLDLSGFSICLFFGQ